MTIMTPGQVVFTEVRAKDPRFLRWAIVACAVVAASWQPVHGGMDLDPAIVLREE